MWGSRCGDTDAVESDQWGVPQRMFGDVEEDFYGLVGRITLVAALFEDRLHVLYSAVAQAPQECLAGQSGTLLIEGCRQRLDSVRPERRDEAAEFLAAAQVALLKRHEVVHSLWPFSSRGEVRGWRNVPKSRRQRADRPVEWTSLHAGQLPGLLADLVDLVERCRRVEQWVVPPPVP